MQCNRFEVRTVVVDFIEDFSAVHVRSDSESILLQLVHMCESRGINVCDPFVSQCI